MTTTAANTLQLEGLEASFIKYGVLMLIIPNFTIFYVKRDPSNTRVPKKYSKINEEVVKLPEAFGSLEPTLLVLLVQELNS